MVIIPKGANNMMTMEDIMRIASKKPAYKMKKSEIIAELKNVYGVTIKEKKLKKELVFILQSHRNGDCCNECECKDKRDDLQEVNVMDDKTAWKHFFNMFKFWN